ANVERAVETRIAGTERELLRLMPEQTAVQQAREIIAPGAEFPSSRYPLVHSTTGPPGVRLDRPDGRRPNVLMIFVEGLDRRFLDGDGHRAASRPRPIALRAVHGAQRPGRAAR